MVDLAYLRFAGTRLPFLLEHGILHFRVADVLTILEVNLVENDIAIEISGAQIFFNRLLTELVLDVIERILELCAETQLRLDVSLLTQLDRYIVAGPDIECKPSFFTSLLC